MCDCDCGDDWLRIDTAADLARYLGNEWLTIAGKMKAEGFYDREIAAAKRAWYRLAVQSFPPRLAAMLRD